MSNVNATARHSRGPSRMTAARPVSGAFPTSIATKIKAIRIERIFCSSLNVDAQHGDPLHPPTPGAPRRAPSRSKAAAEVKAGGVPSHPPYPEPAETGSFPVVGTLRIL